MLTDDFDYPLPDELIAQEPAVPRESCRLLVLHAQSGVIEHRRFSDVLEYLERGDLLVVNDTKVMPSRLLGQKEGTGAHVEVLLLNRTQQGMDTGEDSRVQMWEALVKPGRRMKPGTRVVFEGLNLEVVGWADSGTKGQRLVRLESTGGQSVTEALESLGHLPLPPYIKSYSGDTSLYQTVYAREQNSAAAPTAGLHFSEQLLAEAQLQGIERASICLEIGIDTFRSVEEDRIEDHRMHSEAYSISEDTVGAVRSAQKRGGRIIAVGTTVVRALESATDDTGALKACTRERTQLYITPGYHFKTVDALITNFHTPRSTLLMLVCAFVGYDALMEAYHQALEERYRFLSFGDAMLLLRD